MKRGQYITPPSPPSGMVAFLITIPTGPHYAGALRGFLLDLCNPENWEQIEGTISPCDAAAFAEIMLSSFEEKETC